LVRTDNDLAWLDWTLRIPIFWPVTDALVLRRDPQGISIAVRARRRP
jgi:hypothetical protein